MISVRRGRPTPKLDIQAKRFSNILMASINSRGTHLPITFTRDGETLRATMNIELGADLTQMGSALAEKDMRLMIAQTLIVYLAQG